ncbi:MAG TPA: hypothetical protein DCS85_00500 [Verrucomicrobiales bacterium]|nr:hypothetical protein [Verrucomicrobiales bacterium]
MPRSFAFAIFMAAALLPNTLAAAGKKAPDLSVSFHLQAEPGDRRAFKQLTAGKEVLFSKSAEISTKDIVAFRSFPADDGNSYGIVFQLNKMASNRLRNMSTAHQDKLLLAVVNGQVRDAVLIDKPVNDGLVVIWKWVSLAEVKLADQHVPRIGEDPKTWKKRIKKK